MSRYVCEIVSSHNIVYIKRDVYPRKSNKLLTKITNIHNTGETANEKKIITRTTFY